MSAGRLQLYDKRAGPRDRTSRLLVRLDGRARAAPARVRLQAGGVGEAAARERARAGRRARDARAGSVAAARRRSRELLDAPRPLHALLRDQHVIAGIGRSWVDEILWQAQLSPYKRGADLDDDEAERLRDGDRRDARRRDRPLRAGGRAADPRQAADAAARAPPRGRAVPALRDDAAGGPLRGLRDRLLPRPARPTGACSRTGASRACCAEQHAPFGAQLGPG